MFTIKDLKQALDTVKSVVNPRSPSPIHACVLLTCERVDGADQLTLRAYNPAVIVSHTVPCDMGDACSFAVNAAQLYDFVRALGAGAEIECKYNERKSVAEFRSGGYTVTLRTLPAEDFPDAPQIDTAEAFDVDGSMFYDALRRGSIARIKDSNSSFAESSVAMQVKDEHLMIATNDHNRIAIADGIEVSGMSDGQFLLAQSAVDYLKSLGEWDNEVRVLVGENGAQFVFPNTLVYVARVDGTLSVPVEILPQNFTCISKVGYRDFQTAVNVVTVMMPGDEERKVIELHVKNGKMTVKPLDMPDTDTSSAVFECEHNADINLTLRPVQIKDYFSVTGDDELQIRTGGVIQHENAQVAENVSKIVNLYTEAQRGFSYYMAPLNPRNAKSEGEA